MTAVLSERRLPAQLGVRGDPPPGFPVEPNTSSEPRGRLVLWLGPDEWLVLGGREGDYPDAAATVDLSATRVCLELAGARAVDVLAQGCSLDLETSVFPPGRCAQTLLARAQIVLHRRADDRFWLLVRPSVAGYLQAWLEDAIDGLEAWG